MKVIIDSGSDITLISEDALYKLISKPKVRSGQKIKLIQVTGTSSISGFVNLEIYFITADGPVRIDVEAYVVKGMTAPFILGNDFTDQYQISTMRKDGESHLIFGDSGRQLQVESSTGSSLTDAQGQTFKIRTLLPSSQHLGKLKAHRQHQKIRRRTRNRMMKAEVRSAERGCDSSTHEQGSPSPGSIQNR